ncbi:MAG: hypothetical protein U1A16_00515 [Patescibacteria group bacterium]|nr:hypothetical protein [Patescibacteria group bacterium]
MSAIPRKIAIELRYLQRIAYTDWIAARILRNLGFFYQPMWLLGQSIEKYVYILWIESHARLPQGRLRRKLKEFSARGVGMRGLAPLFNALPKATKTLLHESWQSWVKYESAYRGKIPFAGYSDTAFRVSERFVRDIRVVLGETPKKNFLEEWAGIAAQHSPLKRERMVQVMKGILALKNPTLTKRLRRTYARKIRQIAELFQRA